MKETKEDRFKRVAEYRVNKLLNNIRLLSNCSNKRMYKWNDVQIRKIWSVIDQELRSCKSQFIVPKDKNFTL